MLMLNGAVYSTKAEDSRIYRPIAPTKFICGIADGHGGPAAARLCREQVERLDDFPDCPAAFFAELHRQCRALRCHSGASLTLCFVDGASVRCVNVGDSHAVVVTPTSHYWLSESHRLQDNVRERARLGSSVGWAQSDGAPQGPPRLYPGGLACSRAIGDGDCPLVSCEPSVCRAELLPDDILIVASDGLWDALPLARICQLARQSRCAEAILRSHTRSFSDDTSAILVSSQPTRRSFFRVMSNGSISSDDDEPPPRRVLKVSL